MNQEKLLHIPMVDLDIHHKKIEKEILTAITEVISSSAFINGPQVAIFAESLCQKIGSKYCIPCGNGTDALMIAFMALELEAGDEIIMPNFTYAAPAEMAALLGLKPVLIDVDPNSFNINPKLIEEAITSKTKAICAVHLFGQSADLQTIKSICSKNNLYLIEDNAQALGSKVLINQNWQFTGTVGDISTCSFFPSKNLGALGDGGAIFSNSEALWQRSKMISNHGQRIKYHHEILGMNSRLDTIQAALLNVKLKYLDSFIEGRQKAAERYDKMFEGMELQIPSMSEFSTHSYHQYNVVLPNGIDREEVRKKLSKKGVSSAVYYPNTLSSLKPFAKNDKKSTPCADFLSKNILALPIYPEIRAEFQERVSSALLSAL